MRSRAKLAVVLSVLALSACAGTGSRDRYDYLLRQPVANPSEVVAAELAFARAAQEDGQWTAFREYSTDDALMFVPEMVNAHEWLDGRADPAQAVQWQPHQVWSSCDGTLAVTKGAWQRPDGTFGYFTTVWERQDNGEYKWVLDQGDRLAQPLTAPDFVLTNVAPCNSDMALTEPGVVDPNREGGGASRDATLTYEWEVGADRSRRIRVYLLGQEDDRPVLDVKIAAPTQ